MSSNYYYLVSSLPDLRLDDYKEPYRVDEFIEELQLSLAPEHFQWARDILYANDNPNIADILCKSGNTWLDARGNYTFKQMEELLSDPERIDEKKDDYIVSFYNEFQGLQSAEDHALNRAETEELLLKIFYSKMMSHQNEFIKKYFTFDYYLRNVLLAMNKRRFKDQKIEFLELSGNDIIGRLKNSSAADFGLLGNLDFINRLIEIFEKEDIVHREKSIDQLRWEMIDTINTFAYFKVDVLLGYLLKLIMVERWIALTEQKGKEAFEKLSKVDEKILEGFLN
jgi:hypothetical protein